MRVNVKVYFTVKGEEMTATVHATGIGSAVASVKRQYPDSKVWKVDVLDE